MAVDDLENNHNVYILGAGFSVDANQPVISDFLKRMRDAAPWLESQGRTEELQAIADVLKFRRDAAAAAYRVHFEAENVEELFSLASAEPSGTLAGVMPLALAATIDHCSKTHTLPRRMFHIHPDHLASTQLAGAGWGTVDPGSVSVGVGYQVYESTLYQAYVAAMLGLMGPEAPSKNTFITFNYDTVLEEAIRGCRGKVDYGIPSRGMTAAADWVAFGTGVPVLKLHGSVNWALPGRRGTKMTAFDSYDGVRQAGLGPVLVPPTWRKEFGNQLVHVWNAAVEAIAHATRIVVIGFSIPPTDLHFRYLLAAGLRRNISLRKIIFITRDVEMMIQRAGEILRDVATADGTVEFSHQGVACLLPRCPFADDVNERAADKLGRPVSPRLSRTS